MKWDVADLVGYEPFTTIYDDLSIAENFGKEQIEMHAHDCFESWKSDYKLLTELVMALNHKSWEHAHDELCAFYSDLYYKYDGLVIDYLEEHGTKEELNYFFRTLD